MGYIRLENVSFINPPSGTLLYTVKYRLTADPDIPASYVTATAALSIAADGSITPPYDITGLDDETDYTVKINSNCGGASAILNITTGSVCPDVSAIVGVGNAGDP